MTFSWIPLLWIPLLVLLEVSRENLGLCRVQTLNTNFFFSIFSGTRGISRQKSRDIPPKRLFPWVPKDILNSLGPTPSRRRPPSHLKISGTESLALGWDIVGLLEGLERPLPRKPRKKSEKGFPMPPGPGVKKARKRVENDNFSSFWGFWLVFDSFSSFFSPDAGFSRERPF